MGDTLQSTSDKVILHIDLDCFYCQVEHRRLNIPRDVPLAVQQWDGLIAVNYPARSRGITRHMTKKEAQRRCPDLCLVHVETLGGEGEDETSEANGRDVPEEEARLSRKACLERYRKANAEILDVLHQEMSNAKIEKASIDEVYMDVSKAVSELILQKSFGELSGEGEHLFSWGSVVYGPEPLDPRSETDLRLSLGAMIASRLRGSIHTRCGFTSSAGIACNKLLAKVGSAKNKPNQQTLIRPNVNTVTMLMKELPLRSLKNFGGKLGDELEQLCMQYSNSKDLKVFDVTEIPFEALQAKFGVEKSKWIINHAHGQDDSAVVERERQKSMLAAKSFASTSDLAVVEKWLLILASELAPRMRADFQAYNRRPRTLSLHFRSASGERTRQSPMPRLSPENPCKKTIASAAMEIFKTRCAVEGLPCSRLAISASDFQPCPDKSKSITRFFSNAQKSIPVVHEPAKKGVEILETQANTLSTSADIFTDVDLEEQKRLLREASMLHQLQTKRKNRDDTGTEKRPKSGNIAKFFSHKQQK
jgi:DNA polymerase eta